MAEYKYVDWPGLQYYHGKVTELIDSRLRDCIKFGGEVLFGNLDSPDTPDLNVVYRVLNSFTVEPSNEWFDESTWNNTYPAGTLLQVVQDTDGVVYKVFMQPAINGGGGGSDVTVDLSNYYTIAEVDAKIVDALKPYATIEFVTVKLEAIQSLLDAHIDDFGKLATRVSDVEETLETRIGPAITQLEKTAATLAETKADVDDIPSLEGYATEEFVATAIAAIEIPENVDLSSYAKTADVDAKIDAVNKDIAVKADKSELEGLASESYVDEKFASIEHPAVPTKVSELENDAGYVTADDLTDREVYTLNISGYTANQHVTPEQDLILSRLYDEEPHDSLRTPVVVTYVKDTQLDWQWRFITRVSTDPFTGMYDKYLTLYSSTEMHQGDTQTSFSNCIYKFARHSYDTSWFLVNSEKIKLENVATEQFVQDSIDAIEIPETDLSNYYNKTETENIVNEAVGNISIPEVPTNVSAFVNDAGYITEHQDLSEYAKLTDIPDTSNLATETFVTQKIAEAQLSEGEVDLSAFYTKDEIDAKGFATEEYVQQQLDDADVVGMDARITVLETNTTTVTERVDAVEDQAETNEAAITALSGEIDRVDETLLTMDTQITNISQNLADLQAYGTF